MCRTEDHSKTQFEKDNSNFIQRKIQFEKDNKVHAKKPLRDGTSIKTLVRDNACTRIYSGLNNSAGEKSIMSHPHICTKEVQVENSK